MDTFWLFIQFSAYIVMLLGGIVVVAVAIDGLHSLFTGQLHFLSRVDPSEVIE